MTTPATNPATNPAAPPRLRPTSTTRGNRFASVIIALACIVVAGIAVNVTNNISSDVVRTVGVNQRTRLDNAFVTVTGVRAGTAIAGDAGDGYKSGGMILAVKLRVEAPGTKYTVGGLGGAILHASGRTYSVFGPNDSIVAEAGFASTGELLFEVDPHQIAGAYLEIYHAEFIYVTPEKVHVRLGITSRNAAQWVASAQGVTLNVKTATSEPLS